MKRKGIFLFFILLFLSMTSANIHWQRTLKTVSSDTVHSSESQLFGSLHAKYAVLLDGDSGNILFGKNEDQAAAMASTTKIMTCIVALEMEKAPEICVMSPLASLQPKVHLGVSAGTTFRTEALYYSMMLESHNDSAACIAENMGAGLLGSGKVQADTDKEESQRYLNAFLEQMNRKAREIGCEDTYFATTNGLDKEVDGNKHHSTAADMARILKYCIYESDKKEEFLEITRTVTYEFSDVSEKMNFHCSNHNQLLQMMNDAVSGKTGFTGDAGYCYVGAVERNGKKFIIALLACGWPNNRSYKWKDVETLVSYGDEQYERVNLADENPVTGRVIVNNARSEKLGEKVSIFLQSKNANYFFLKKKGENIETKIEIPKEIEAPVSKGDKIGRIIYTCGGEKLASEQFFALENAEKINFEWCLCRIAENFVI